MAKYKSRAVKNLRTNIFLELQFKIVCNRLKENRVSRLFLRDDSRASKKSKSTDFGFFLYLLAKTAFYWLFFQNNRSDKCALLYEGIQKNISVFRLWNAKKCPWIYRGVWKISLRKFKYRPSTFTKNCPWYSRGKKFWKKFYRHVYIFDHKCPWLSERKFYVRPRTF